MLRSRYALSLSILLATSAASAQVTTPPVGGTSAPATPAAPPATPAPTKPVPYGPGMKVNISPDGSKYLRFMLWTQVFVRYNENNTNTLRAPNLLKESQVDFSLRSSRMIVLATAATQVLFAV